MMFRGSRFMSVIWGSVCALTLIGCSKGAFRTLSSTSADRELAGQTMSTGRTLDIRDFGARCDGSDDAGAIQNAINNLQDGDTLVFSCRAGVGGAGLIIADRRNITLTGTGGDTGIRLVARPGRKSIDFWTPANTTLEVRRSQNVTVRNLTIDLNNYFATGIGVAQTSDSHFDGNNIFGTPWISNEDPNVEAHACIAAWGGNNNTFNYNRIRNCYWGLYLGNGGNPGPAAWYENYFQANYNDIADNTWDAIAHHGEGATFIGNKTNNTVGCGIKFCAAGTSRLLFQGNTITNVKSCQGIQICQTNYGTAPVDILDNYIDTTADGGITVDNGQPYPGKITIAGNTVRNSKGSGNIYILSSNNVEIRNNDLEDTGPGQVGIKIRTDFGGLVQGVDIHHNNIKNNSEMGILLLSSSGGNNMSGIQIHDNAIFNNSTGLYVLSQGGPIGSVNLYNNCFANNGRAVYDDRGQLSAGQNSSCSQHPVSSGSQQPPTPQPTSAPTPQPTQAPQPNPISGSQFRINLAGPAYTDSTGVVWSADPGLMGQNYTVGNSISNTSDPTLYQSQKWDFGSFHFPFTVPNGRYNVTLKFAEIYWNEIGKRVFDVAVNDQTVLANFDILKEAGAAFQAVDRTIQVDITNGQLDVKFTTVVDAAAVNAIVITPVITQAPGNLVRVNVAGPAYTDSTGTAWSADNNLPGIADITSAPITGTSAPEIYQTQKFSFEPMDYRFNIPNGTYRVTMKFAEIYWDTSGRRVFDVDANGQRVISQFDIFAQAGGKYKAVDRSFNVSITNGELVLHMAATVDCPAINALEIVPVMTSTVSKVRFPRR